MIRHLLHLPSVVSLARQILGIKRPDDLMAIADATRETTLADYAAQVADLQPVTEADFDLEPRPFYNNLVADRATDRARMFGDCDFDEWARELHPSNWDGDAA